jgi:oligopeptide/dipeptide ABC transporter ATP-binding protein
MPRIEVKEDRLHEIKGVVPNPSKLPLGCKFYPRCNFSFGKCEKNEPPFIRIRERRFIRCWKFGEK